MKLEYRIAVGVVLGLLAFPVIQGAISLYTGVLTTPVILMGEIERQRQRDAYIREQSRQVDEMIASPIIIEGGRE